MPPELMSVTHFGRKCAIEKEPILMAFVPVSGKELHQGILVHPRYVPKGFAHKKVKIRGRLRGRTLYCLLEEPLSLDGGKYPVLNFKGVGADDGDKLVIDCENTHDRGRRFRRESSSDSPWGGITLRSAQREAEFRLISEAGLPFSPAISVDTIPQELQSVIGVKVGETLVQLKRVTNTTIRVNEVNEGELDLQTIATVIVRMIRMEARLAQKGEVLSFNGRPTDNWYLDGMLTDAENYRLMSLYEHPLYRGAKEFERSDNMLINQVSFGMFQDLYEQLSTEGRDIFVGQFTRAIKQVFSQAADFEKALIRTFFDRLAFEFNGIE